ncbi:MAG: hypothetical protein HZB26_21160 [Candidatus Hydrogenedentes bacterium]|nr:hypothetical protein [Candidatus Hydrogenedentota bacterium]
MRAHAGVTPVLARASIVRTVEEVYFRLDEMEFLNEVALPVILGVWTF